MMFYYFDPVSHIILRLIFSFGWQAISAVATIAIGIFAWRISKRQAEISERQANLDDYADIFIRPHLKSPNVGHWELQIRTACPRPIYLLPGSYFEGKNNEKFPPLKFSRDEPALLPPGEENYYSYTIPDLDQIEKDSNDVPTFHLHIKFRDILNKERTSHHAGWFQKNVWVIHNLESTIPDQDGSKVDQN